MPSLKKRRKIKTVGGKWNNSSALDALNLRCSRDILINNWKQMDSKVRSPAEVGPCAYFWGHQHTGRVKNRQ